MEKFWKWMFAFRERLSTRWQSINSSITVSKMRGDTKSSFIGSPIECQGLEHVTLGNNVRIVGPCRIEAISKWHNQNFSPEIVFGDNVNIEAYSHIGAIGRITIGNGVLMGSKVLITDHIHGSTSDLNLPPNVRPLHSHGDITIEDNVWIGDNATILSGVTIGHHSIVGANAVVTKNFPPYSIIGGVPARLIKQATESLQSSNN